MVGDYVGGLTQFLGSLQLPFRGHDLGAALSFGFGFLGHGALHGLGELDVFDFDDGNDDTPRLRETIQDGTDLLVDGVPLGEYLIELEATDDIAHGGLGDLVDGSHHVLDGDDTFDWVLDLIVGHGRDIDRDIVLSDDTLLGDGEGDSTEIDFPEDIDGRDDPIESSGFGSDDAPKPEYYAGLVLLNDTESAQYDEYKKSEYGFHGGDINFLYEKT